MSNISTTAEQNVSHVVAIPYPGRGHINPMINLCHLLASRSSNNLLITFFVTEECLGFIGSDDKPANTRFVTIPNVLRSELIRVATFEAFMAAFQTKMEPPFEQLLDRLEPPVKFIISDTLLKWVVQLGNRRNIPVASFWTMSASSFKISYHFDLLVQNHHSPVELSERERGDEYVDCIPGLSTMRMADLIPPPLFGKDRQSLKELRDAVSFVPRAQYLLLACIYELEGAVLDALKAEIPIPVCSIGPNIPYFKVKANPPSNSNSNDLISYLKWLDSKSPSTVLYISQGSFHSVSSAQMDEIAAGVRESGVPYLWVAREEASRLNDEFGGSAGLVVPWCDQLRVLCHSSIGGFWTHCGWNSVMESIFAGVPMLTCPISVDQPPNRRLIVEDWKNGWDVMGTESLVKREEIAELVRRFMDLESIERKAMMERVKEVQKICQQAIEKGGSSDTNVNAFIRNIFTVPAV